MQRMEQVLENFSSGYVPVGIRGVGRERLVPSVERVLQAQHLRSL